jgi:Flp pilus assembly protein TadD
MVRKAKAKRRTRDTRPPPERAGPAVAVAVTRRGVVSRRAAVSALIAASVVILVFLLYASSLKGPFTFDDWYNIRNNEHLRVTNLWPTELLRAGLSSVLPTRLVAYASFAANYYLHEFDTFGYRLVNVFIHLTTGLLLYALVDTTLRLPALSHRHYRHREIAFFVALIWLVHPLATQSVAYIVQRMNSMATMFYIASLLLFVRGRLQDGRWAWAFFGASAISGFLALGSKENAATLPVVMLLYEWYFLQDLDGAWLRRRVLTGLGVLLALSLVVVAFMGTNPVQALLSEYDRYDFTMKQRVLTELRVVLHYLSLILLPHPSRLSVDKDFALSDSLLAPPTTMLSLLAVGSMLGLAVASARKERLLSFCVLWFLGNLVIESSVYPLEIIYDHRTYLPSIGVCVVIVLGAASLRAPPWAGRAALALFATVLSLWTYQRARLWGDEVALWQDVVEKAPGLARARVNLGDAYWRTGEVESASLQFRQALGITSRYPRAQNNLGSVLIEMGRESEAVEHLSEAIRLDPEYMDAHYNLGVALGVLGQTDEAVPVLRRAVELDPSHALAQRNLGVLLFNAGRPDEAAEHLARAAALQPHDGAVRTDLGAALLAAGRADAAAQQFREALRRQPDLPRAQRGLQEALERLQAAGETPPGDSSVIR